MLDPMDMKDPLNNVPAILVYENILWRKTCGRNRKLKKIRRNIRRLPKEEVML